MSRSGYSYDLDDAWGLIKWRGQVASATRGKRGQKLIRDLIAALDAMPVKELITHELEEDGGVCALGAVGKLRGIDLSKLDPDEPDDVAAAFDIAAPLAREIVFENDEGALMNETPHQRWARIREWAERQLRR